MKKSDSEKLKMRTVYVSDVQWNKLGKIAKKRGLTGRSQVLREAISNALKDCN